MDNNLNNNIRTGTSYIKKGSLFGIIDVILTVPLYFIDFLFFENITKITSKPFNFNNSILSMPFYYLFIVISFASLILLAISIVYYRRGFKSFSYKYKQYSNPFSYSKYVIIFYIIMMIGFVLLILYSSGIISGLNIYHNTTVLILILISALAVLIISILSLIGFIYIVIGLYTFSEMAHQNIGKIGAIFFIIPFLSVLTPFFMYISSSRTEKRLN